MKNILLFIVTVLMVLLIVPAVQKRLPAPTPKRITRTYLVSFMAENKSGGTRNSYQTVSLDKPVVEWTVQDVLWFERAMLSNDFTITSNIVIQNIIPLAP